ncbi:MAG: helix-turn-helix domain-containing protein [Bacteroidales bacterium]|jgi:AraC-like DNA-binding protein
MEVLFYDAPQCTSWLVKRFESINYTGGPIIEKFIPTKYSGIVFHFDDLPTLSAPFQMQLPKYFVVPLRPVATTIRLEGNLHTFIALCKPTVLSAILHIELTHPTLPYVPLPAALFEPLWQELSKATTDQERVDIFCSYFNTKICKNYKPDELDTLYDYILTRSKATRICDIISEYSKSNRTLQRAFYKRTGITPKSLLRIVRINHIWQSIKNGTPPDYQDLVLEGNYFDQTHFIKDFKAITGETPGSFFNRDLKIVKALSGNKY